MLYHLFVYSADLAGLDQHRERAHEAKALRCRCRLAVVVVGCESSFHMDVQQGPHPQHGIEVAAREPGILGLRGAGVVVVKFSTVSTFVLCSVC